MSIVVQELIDDLMKIVERLELSKDDALKPPDEDEVHGSYLPNEWASRRNRADDGPQTAMSAADVFESQRKRLLGFAE